MSHLVTGSEPSGKSSRRSTRRTACFVVTAIAVTALALGCGSDDGPKTPLADPSSKAGPLPAGHPPIDPNVGLTQAARVALDSGNAAFRTKGYARALRFYREAADAAPAHASPWFGIYMVGQATHNTALRDSAMREVKKRTVDPPGVADSTLRNTHPASKKRAAP